MIAFLESRLAKSPGKSTLAEWLDGGLLVFPAISSQQNPNEPPGNYEDWLGACNGSTVFIGELVTALWTKRARGPTARVGAPLGPMPRASTLIAVDKDGVRLSTKTYDDAPTASDFSVFVLSAGSSLSSRQGAMPGEIGVVCDRRYIREDLAASLVSLSVKAWVLDERSAQSTSPIPAAIEAARLQIVQRAQQIDYMSPGIRLAEAVAASLI